MYDTSWKVLNIERNSHAGYIQHSYDPLSEMFTVGMKCKPSFPKSDLARCTFDYAAHSAPFLHGVRHCRSLVVSTRWIDT